MALSYISSFFTTQDSTIHRSSPCIHDQQPQSTPCLDCKADTAARRKYRFILIFCLFWPFILQALDSTIIASSLPWIARDFDRLSEQNWIVSSFNLTSAAFIPFWAQIADVFGRHAAISSATVIMIVGSALCTAAPTTAFPMLLLGRALQGVAASGLSVVTRTILADGQSLQESAKNWAIFAFIGGQGYGFGPIIGGYLTKSSWRWCFGINLPVGAVALVVIFLMLRKHLLGPQPIPELDETVDTGRRTKLFARIKTIDFGGQALFIAGFGLLTLGLTWAGATYPWLSAAVLVPVISGILLIIGFGAWERALSPEGYLTRILPRQRAMIPWKILSTRNIGLLFFTECSTGISVFSVLYFCSAYLTLVKAYKPDEAGKKLALFTAGLAGGVIICSILCNRWPKMSWPPLALGSFVEAIAVGFFTYALYLGNVPTILGMMAFVGIGIGIRFMGAPLHGIGLFPEHRASIIAIIAVTLPLGGTVGLTIMSTVFNNVSGGLNLDKIDFEAIQRMPADEREAHLHLIKMGIVWAYVSIMPILVTSFCCTLFLGNVSLCDGEPTGEFVVREPYIWHLIKSRKTTTETSEGRYIQMSAIESPDRRNTSGSNAPLAKSQN